MKTDPYYQRHKCRPMTVVSGGIRFMRIFAEIPREGGIKRQRGCPERQFSAISMAIFSDTLEMRPVLLYSDTQSIVGFSVIPKRMTLNDQGYFALNSVFAPVWLAETARLRKITPPTNTAIGRAHNNSTTCCTTNSPPTDKNLPHSNILTCRDFGLWHCDVANLL